MENAELIIIEGTDSFDSASQATGNSYFRDTPVSVVCPHFMTQSIRDVSVYNA